MEFESIIHMVFGNRQISDSSFVSGEDNCVRLRQCPFCLCGWKLNEQSSEVDLAGSQGDGALGSR